MTILQVQSIISSFCSRISTASGIYRLIHLKDEQILELYAEIEALAEKGEFDLEVPDLKTLVSVISSSYHILIFNVRIMISKISVIPFAKIIGILSIN
jgi:hypothetical protein